MSTIPFPLEQHTKSCLFNALKSALENFRDQEGQSYSEFRARVQSDLLAEADGYLNDGLQTCICRVAAFQGVVRRFELTLLDEWDDVADLAAEYGVSSKNGTVADRLYDYARLSARDLAMCELTNRAFSPEDCMQTVGMIDRKVGVFARPVNTES